MIQLDILKNVIYTLFEALEFYLVLEQKLKTELLVHIQILAT